MSASRRGSRWWLGVLCATQAVLALACRDEPPAHAAQLGLPGSSSSLAVPPADAAAAVDWAAHVVDAPGLPPSAASLPPSHAATLPDHAYEAGPEVPARHLVYRVSFVVPTELRGGRPLLAAPAGELHIDVSRERLRARFVGPGWPCDEGTEVRLRADVPGVYLFDGRGGRPLPPGRLAAWFQGDEGGRTRGGVHVHRETGAKGEGPGELVCALLAEWTRQDREDVLPRCAGGSLAPGFRFGLWSAELTAIVPLNLAPNRLRADAGDPPQAIAALESRAILEPSELAKLAPSRVRLPARLPPIEPGLGSGALDVYNDTDARVIVIAQGVPVGWVRARAHGHFAGFTPGYYYVGAVRPFGQPAMHAALVAVPGSVHLGKLN